MKTNHERNNSQRGNALIYVLIAIALFGALSFVMARQNDTGESTVISSDKATLYATQLISYATQTKQVVDQMIFSGGKLDTIDFTPPSDPTFNTGTTGDHIHMIYHPDGGGLIPGSIPAEAISQKDSDPVAGWYLGRFNNVDWSKTSADDVILVAYQIRPEVCLAIDKKLGVTTIPDVDNPPKELFVDDALFTAGSNSDLTTDSGEACPDCKNKASLCVKKDNIYAFYTIVGDQ